MDPIAILLNRIEQLEAKLGVQHNVSADVDGQQQFQQGDSVTANLINSSHAISNATADHQKLPEAVQMATELNNYIDPNLIENMQKSNMHMQEIAAAEPLIRHHCQCMHHCKQAAPVLESEAIKQVPQMQTIVNDMQAAAAEVKTEADAVSQGVQELAETCGAAATEASEKLATVAQKTEQLEEKLSPRRRNGLD